MLSIFDFQNSQSYLQAYIESQGPGVRKKLAQAMSISSSLFSQIMAGTRLLSNDQAYRLAQFWDFNSFEKVYWLTLVELTHAGSGDLKKFLGERLSDLRSEAKFKARKKMGLKRTTWSPEFIATFYSSWHLPALYCVLVIDQKWTDETLAQRFSLSPRVIQSAMDFFVRHGIVRKTSDGQYVLKNSGYVYIDAKDADAHAAAVLHNCKNFRQKAMAVFEQTKFDQKREGIFHTVTALVSRKDFELVQAEVQKLLESLNKKIAKSNFEEVMCLNIDSFRL